MDDTKTLIDYLAVGLDVASTFKPDEMQPRMEVLAARAPPQTRLLVALTAFRRECEERKLDAAEIGLLLMLHLEAEAIVNITIKTAAAVQKGEIIPT